MLLVLFVFFVLVKYLPNRCVVSIRGYPYRNKDWWERYMEQAAEMGSGAMIFVPRFIKMWSTIQNLIPEGGARLK
jgi:hypothetical protein